MREFALRKSQQIIDGQIRRAHQALIRFRNHLAYNFIRLFKREKKHDNETVSVEYVYVSNTAAPTVATA